MPTGTAIRRPELRKTIKDFLLSGGSPNAPSYLIGICQASPARIASFRRNAVNFYTGQPVRMLNGREANLWYGSLFPDAPQIFDDTTSFQGLWNGSRRVFLWTEADNEEEALRGIDRKTVFVLARFGGKVVLTNRPVEETP